MDCVDTYPPSPSPTPIPTLLTSAQPSEITEMPSVQPTGTTTTTNTTVDGGSLSNSPTGLVVCPPGQIGFYVWPNTKCVKYAQCDDGMIVKEFECPEGTLFYQESGLCRSVENGTNTGPYSLGETE